MSRAEYISSVKNNAKQIQGRLENAYIAYQDVSDRVLAESTFYNDDADSLRALLYELRNSADTLVKANRAYEAYLVDAIKAVDIASEFGHKINLY